MVTWHGESFWTDVTVIGHHADEDGEAAEGSRRGLASELLNSNVCQILRQGLQRARDFCRNNMIST
jgi:hypothetical protein